MDPFTGCFVPDSTSASYLGLSTHLYKIFVHDLRVLENNTFGFHFGKKILVFDSGS